MGNMVGSYSQIGKTFILEDENGNEMTGVITENAIVFDATAADIKIGKKAVTDDGVTEGTDTKTYRTTHGTRLILPGETFSVLLDEYEAYDYTKFQAMISVFNTTEFNSVAIDKISLYDTVYDVGSSDKISDVTKNMESKCIDLNFTNDTNSTYIIHFNTYKEE
jgi:hypothetical protein